MLAQSGQLANTRLLLAPNGYKSQVQDHENYMCSNVHTEMIKGFSCRQLDAATYLAR